MCVFQAMQVKSVSVSLCPHVCVPTSVSGCTLTVSHEAVCVGTPPPSEAFPWHECGCVMLCVPVWLSVSGYVCMGVNVYVCVHDPLLGHELSLCVWGRMDVMVAPVPA